MVLPLFFILCTAVFVCQLVFCFSAKMLWIKLLPLVAIGLADAVCWIVYGLGIFSEIYGGAFAAYIYGIVLLVALVVVVLAWVVYGIVKSIQKRRK